MHYYGKIREVGDFGKGDNNDQDNRGNYYFGKH